MAVSTVAFFATGGFFTALYSNAVRRFPLMRSKYAAGAVGSRDALSHARVGWVLPCAASYTRAAIRGKGSRCCGAGAVFISSIMAQDLELARARSRVVDYRQAPSTTRETFERMDRPMVPEPRHSAALRAHPRRCRRSAPRIPPPRAAAARRHRALAHARAAAPVAEARGRKAHQRRSPCVPAAAR